MEGSSIAIIVTNTLFLAIAAISLALRLWRRHVTSAGYSTDDWLAIAAFGFSAALSLTNILGVPFGSFGAKPDTLAEDQTVIYLKIFFIIQFWYIAAVAATKLTVLYLLKRIFSSPRTPVIIWILIYSTIAWAIAFITATLFQILPIWCNWVVCTPTSNYPLMYLMSSITDLVLNLIILCLPVFFIRKLHMPLARKIDIGSIFGVGFFCVIASAARLYYTWAYMHKNSNGENTSNFDVSADNFIMWSGIEACVSATCANLPTYGSIVVLTRGLFNFQSFKWRLGHRANTGDTSVHPVERRWPGTSVSLPRYVDTNRKSRRFSYKIRSLSRLSTDGGEGTHHLSRFLTRTTPVDQRLATINSSQEALRYSGSTCNVESDRHYEPDRCSIVTQTVEMSVIRTSATPDGEFRILPCSPVEAVMRT